MVRILKETELDDKYHVTLLDSKTNKTITELQFQTLEEVLGCLHGIEEPENRGSLLLCLMKLRDGVSEVFIHREAFQTGEQILRIRPPKRFPKLFWEGFRKK